MNLGLALIAFVVGGDGWWWSGRMPILDVDKAKKVYVVKRGQGKGYAGIVNAPFYGENCDMVHGDAQGVLIKMIEAVRGLGVAAAA